MATRKTASSSNTKLFVLDTNVLMHDPTSLFRFEEHDVYLPIFVLEELDNNKKGMSEVARNARQATRFIDNLISASNDSIEKGMLLNALGNKNATGRIFYKLSLSTTSCHKIWRTVKPTMPYWVLSLISTTNTPPAKFL